MYQRMRKAKQQKNRGLRKEKADWVRRKQRKGEQVKLDKTQIIYERSMRTAKQPKNVSL